MFVSEQIEVEKSSTDNTLLRFTWRGQKKNIVDVLAVWQDWGFPAGKHKANWRMRHHRNYYRLKCDDSKTYEIYLDRQSAADQKWILYQVLE